MVINNRLRTTDIKKKVFGIKQKRDEFIVGSKKYKKFNKKYYEENPKENIII